MRTYYEIHERKAVSIEGWLYETICLANLNYYSEAVGDYVETRNNFNTEEDAAAWLHEHGKKLTHRTHYVQKAYYID